MQVKLLCVPRFTADFSAVNFPVVVDALMHIPETDDDYGYVVIHHQALADIGVVGGLSRHNPKWTDEGGWRFLTGTECELVEE